MLTVTQSAAAHLASVLKAHQTPEGAAIRLVPDEAGTLQLQVSQPMAEDATFAHEGKTVLVLSPPISAKLKDNTLHIKQDENQPALALA